MNLWVEFQRLQQTSPQFVGEVVSVNSQFVDQRCTVAVLPGLTVQVEVIGTGRSLSVGQRWIIRDGRIVEEAPTGEVFEIEV